MLIGSKTVTPKPESATPKPAPVVRPPPPPLQALRTEFVPARPVPVDLTGGVPVQQTRTAGSGTANPAGNVPQAWGNTCGPNTIMAMEAAVDPSRAAQLSELTGDARAEYEAAIFNSSYKGFIPGSNVDHPGWGYTAMRQQVADRFGGIDETLTRDDYSGNQQGAADALVAALSDGRPVAIGLKSHWMSATDIRGEGDAAEVLIHDSWTGTSAWVPVSEIANGGNWVPTYFSGEDTGINAVSSSSNIWNLVVPSSDTLNPDSTARAAEATELANVQAQEGNWTRRDLPEPPAPSEPPPAIPWRWQNRPIPV